MLIAEHINLFLLDRYLISKVENKIKHWTYSLIDLSTGDI